MPKYLNKRYDMSPNSGLEHISENPDTIAPDGSGIRLLVSKSPLTSRVHALLPVGYTTRAVRHKSVHESWVCLKGSGELWMRKESEEIIIKLLPNTSCDIPAETCFQFRSDGIDPLEILINTTPPWPGEYEAIPCEGKWVPVL